MTQLLLAAAPDGGAAFTETLMAWAKVDNGWQLALVGFGVFAQSMFFCRWIIQWIATERRGTSHMPVMFWWMSMAGASLLLVYYFLRGEPVGVLGQSVGWIVYMRNLHLIRHGGAKAG